MKHREEIYDRTIALVGNPNVGKSSLFNELTGLRQHTGNWTGKTVASAFGVCRYKGKIYRIADLPGSYSLFSRSPEEEVTRQYIISGEADIYCVVCDATCLERNIPLVLQMLEEKGRVIVALNLWDEAEKYSVSVDKDKLSALLGVPVVLTSAKRRRGIKELTECFEADIQCGYIVKYNDEIEYGLSLLPEELSRFERLCIISSARIEEQEYLHAREYLYGAGLYPEKCEELITSSVITKAESIAVECVHGNEKRQEHNRRIDRFMTGKYTALPVMLILLCTVLFITTIGANYPSQWLSALFSLAEIKLNSLFIIIGVQDWIREMLVFGVLRAVGWIVSVMLPPMAIFFPLFTLLEDAGFLPRIAFNMDGCFRCAGSCGKQSLTMCMGFGCNAVGVCGCRIIDSPRERLIAVLTNVFVPCNGRFPMLLTLISAFLIFEASSVYRSILSALVLSVFIILGIIVSLLVSFLLSKTLLRGEPSSFTLELPPYRVPNVGRVLVRSFLDRTLFVLGRAVCVAAPAGLIIWLLANIGVGNISLLERLSQVADPFASIFGLDGEILLGFILGLPANEIVLPLIIMIYNGGRGLAECGSAQEIREILISNGWDTLKCISVLVFCLCHFPCSTTLMTIKKETGSFRWSIAAFIIPTLVGLTLCFIINFAASLF